MYHLAVDIGASSGRHIIGYLEMVFNIISKRKLYDITGIKSGAINTIFQLAASHDTASAVMAIPSNDENVMYTN